MTPQEQQLVDDLFNRLASLEGQQRDPGAEQAIRDGLKRAPNAVYALVQTVLLQDEALKRANARIEELEQAAGAAGGSEPQQGGFLDGMRSLLTGRDAPRGSVPSVRPAAPSGQGSSGVWGAPPRPGVAGSPPPQGYPQPYPQAYPTGGMPMGTGLGGGGSFLGTAAATVAGVVGGAMLLDGIRSMMGGHQGFGDYAPMGPSHMASPRDSPAPVDPGAGSGDLARDAGIGDIGGHQTAASGEPDRARFLGNTDDTSDTSEDD
jgi:hypothetical protein